MKLFLPDPARQFKETRILHFIYAALQAPRSLAISFAFLQQLCKWQQAEKAWSVFFGLFLAFRRDTDTLSCAFKCISALTLWALSILLKGGIPAQNSWSPILSAATLWSDPLQGSFCLRILSLSQVGCWEAHFLLFFSLFSSRSYFLKLWKGRSLSTPGWNSPAWLFDR